MPFLGLPLLIVSFPRPVRFWDPISNEYSSGKDAPLYMSLAPTLVRELSKSISLGQIPPLAVGEAYLARMESRIIILRCIECWFEGSTIIMTGTELEPTSCHALEGTAVDEVLDHSLEDDHQTWINQHMLHTLQVSIIPV
jgi:hypothetical protein